MIKFEFDYTHIQESIDNLVKLSKIFSKEDLVAMGCKVFKDYDNLIFM